MEILYDFGVEEIRINSHNFRGIIVFWGLKLKNAGSKNCSDPRIAKEGEKGEGEWGDGEGIGDMDDDDILVGSTEAYEARCRNHFDPELSQRLSKTKKVQKQEDVTQNFI